MVIPDAYLGSVKTLIACYMELGLFSMSAVKAAHTWFPKAYLEQQQTTQNALHAQNPNGHLRGSWTALTIQYNVTATSRFVAHAVGWRDKKLKSIIANCGTTIEAGPIQRNNSRVEVDENGQSRTVNFTKNIPHPQVVEEYFRHFSVIDVHDHYRQGILEMERYWLTSKWNVRIFSTLLGVS